ncbi:MAG: hypothetical protein JXR70_19505 [Spirochaetales bacterium]|nr:hypothetical protein [Spirochaetales bacterium]
MKQKIICLIAFMLCASITWAQNNDSSTEKELIIQGPYVTKLKAITESNMIILTWQNPDDFKGTILVYRHNSEISNDNLLMASEIAQLNNTKLSYVDFPPRSQSFYYAILLKDENNTVYYNFIPARNITSTALSLAPQSESGETETEITNIKTQVKDDYIVINWKTSEPSRDLMIFRSTKAISSTDDLLGSVSPQSLEGGTSSYSDAAIPGIDYYYSVLDASQYKLGRIKINPGSNATTNAVSIPLSSTSSNNHEDFVSQRSRPLPLLSITRDVEFDQYLITSPTVLLPRKTELSDKTKSALTKLLTNVKPEGDPQMEFQVLEIDRIAESTGAANQLHKMVFNKLNLSNMETLITQLNDFQKTKQSDEIKARVGFYLGQIYYFKGQYQKAILNFIQANDHHYTTVQPWMDACFSKLMEADTK